MKKTYLLSFLVIAMLFAYGQKQIRIPKKVEDSFIEKFPSAKKTEWKKENSRSYIATFKQNNTEIFANFDEQGNLLETNTEIDNSALPEKVINAVKKQFIDYKIIEAKKVEPYRKDIYYNVIIKKDNETIDIDYFENGAMIGFEIMTETETED
ncbi:MAG: PepSY-like domain-containing protein [Bacteroidales bacterium]|nr:PepSY-like domain-containing protein [Bacteroidales bacterium]